MVVGIISILGFGVSVIGLIITLEDIKPVVDDIQKRIDTITIIQKDTKIIRDTVFIPIRDTIVLHDNETASHKGPKDEAEVYHENLEKQKKNYYDSQAESREAYSRSLDEQKEAYEKQLEEEKARYEKGRGR